MRRSWLPMLVIGSLSGAAWAQDAEEGGSAPAEEAVPAEGAADDEVMADEVADGDPGADEAMDELPEAEEPEPVEPAADPMPAAEEPEPMEAEPLEAEATAEDDEGSEAEPMAAAEPVAPPPADGKTLDGEPLMHDGEAPPNAGTARSEIYREVEAENEGRTYSARGADGFAELRVTKKVLPLYPPELQTLYGEQAVRCEAIVSVDEKGRPIWIALDDCPDGFQSSALDALQKWRWEEPSGYVPEEGIRVRVRTGFERKQKRFFPGVTYFRSPEEVTADPELPVLIKSAKMPKYPRNVSAGDDICLISLTVDWKGNTTESIIDECAPPYRQELAKVVRKWKWWWTTPPEKNETHTLVTEVVFRL